MSRLQKKLVQFFESCWEAGFNFYELCEEKDSILWVMLKRRVQFFELYFLFLKKLWITFKKGSIIWLIFQKSTLSKNLILKVILKKFYWKNVQFFESYFDEGSILSIILKKGSILWVIFKKKFNSVSQIQKSSILRVEFKKVQFCESYFPKKVQSFQWYLRRVQYFQLFESFFKKKVQFFASYLNKRSNSVSHIQKFNGSILCVILKK